jgi:hypothetical protein
MQACSTSSGPNGTGTERGEPFSIGWEQINQEVNAYHLAVGLSRIFANLINSRTSRYSPQVARLAIIFNAEYLNILLDYRTCLAKAIAGTSPALASLYLRDTPSPPGRRGFPVRRTHGGRAYRSCVPLRVPRLPRPQLWRASSPL